MLAYGRRRSYGKLPHKSASRQAAAMTILAFTVFTIAGILLRINEHRGWGILCFLIAAVALLAMLL
jgi:hypothetical protein